MTSTTGVQPARTGVLLVGLAALLSACAPTSAGGPIDAPGAPHVDTAPFAGLAQCGDQPFVAVFRGFTAEGALVEQLGSSPSSDIYGVRPDGSVAPVTTDLGSYEFGIAADAATVYASPAPAVAPTAALTPPTDPVLAIAPATGEQTLVLEAGDVGAVAPAPDGSQLALTVFSAAEPPGTGAELPVLVDLPAASAARSLAPTAATGRAGPVAVVTRELTWSPDGRQLAFVTTMPDASQEIRIADASTGETTTRHRSDAMIALLSLDWSPDGMTLLAVEGRAPTDAGLSRDRAVEIDVASGRSSVVLRGVRGDLVYSAADGSRLTMLDNSSESSAVARTWSRGPGGRFVEISSSEIGSDLGVTSADRLDIPRCALP
ncbi:PD40 domain-containing protein [Cellulomonas sp. Root137]|uniref:PD40 domain-containing protein n=1 Tax=Cellulomonas sp. Root137 TaxID=1736459 RepID=UPI000A57BCE7|nr:PD40 domain-containing protein [Cellulomonas sp. Root137]